MIQAHEEAAEDEARAEKAPGAAVVPVVPAEAP